MSGYPCFVNGRVVPHGEPAIRPDDAGFQLGLSIFDTVLFEDGAFVYLAEHLARLERGARELRIPWPPRHDPASALAALAAELCAVDRPLAFRLTLSRGPDDGEPTLSVTVRDVARPADPGVAVALASEERRAGDPLGRVKSTNRIAYVLAREEAQAAGAFEALLVSHEGDVLEGTISNVFAVVDGTLVTPAVERGCLPGTSRGRVLALLEEEPLRVGGRDVPVSVSRLDLADLDRATEVFLTNTTAGVIPVTAVLGRRAELPGAAGPVTSAVRARLRTDRGGRASESGSPTDLS